MQIEALYTYPIKALRAHSLSSAEVTKHGFAHDRRFMLLQPKQDDSGKTTYRNMHIAHDPLGALFFPTLHLDDGKISVLFKPPGSEEKTLDIPLQPSTKGLEQVDVEMHKSPTKAYVMPAEYNDWFSACFGYTVVLAYLGEHYRAVLMSSTHTTEAASNNNASGWMSSITSTATSLLSSVTPAAASSQVTFADCAPYLVVSSTSIHDLDTRFTKDESGKTGKADMMKFRPNIVVSGAQESWEEDFWGEITITGQGNADGGVKIECIHNCGRCKSVNIDYETGEAGKGEEGKLLAKMQSDRRVDKGTKWSPIFGRYSFLHESSEGRTIAVGDQVVVSRRNEEHTRFDWKGLCTT